MSNISHTFLLKLQAPGLAFFVAKRDPSPNEQRFKNWKEGFLILSRRKTKRKRIKASKSTIRNLNNITAKHINTSWTFVAWFSLKTKLTLILVIQLVKTWSFPVQAINVKNVFNVFNVASVRTHFYVKKLFWTKKSANRY